MPPSPILVDSAVLLAARLAFFLLARRFLHSLSPTLRELQKPDVALPLPATQTRPRSASAVSGASIRSTRTPAAEPAPLPAPDTDDDSPDSSYPGSPASARGLLPGAASPTPSGSRGGPSSVEMQLLGAKLQPRVIELAHAARWGRSASSARRGASPASPGKPTRSSADAEPSSPCASPRA
jgi:hypothetical protein